MASDLSAWAAEYADCTPVNLYDAPNDEGFWLQWLMSDDKTMLWVMCDDKTLVAA